MARHLLDAIRNEDIQQAKEIINDETYGCIDSQTAIRDGTALFFCCCRGYTDLVLLFISKNANVNASNRCHATPLHAAADNNHLKIVKLLLDHGADIDDVTHRGDTPLHLAAFRGHADVAQLLLQRGADYRIVNEAKVTAAVQAVSQGHIQLAQYLDAFKELNEAAACHPPPEHASSTRLVDIRPPSPTPSPIYYHTSQTQTFNLPNNIEVTNYNNNNKNSNNNNSQPISSSSNERLQPTKDKTKTPPLINTKLFPHPNQVVDPNTTHFNVVSSLNPSISTSSCLPPNFTSQHYHRNMETSQNNTHLPYSGTKQNIDMGYLHHTTQGLSRGHTSSTPLEQQTCLACSNTNSTQTHSLGNTRVVNRPETRQSTKQTQVTNNCAAGLELPSLPMTSREPEESIDYSMVDLPHSMTSHDTDHVTSVQSIHKSQPSHIIYMPPVSPHSRKYYSNSYNETPSSFPRDTSKPINYQPDSNHSSLISTVSSHPSVLSNGSVSSCYSGDARPGQFEFHTESVPYYQDTPPYWKTHPRINIQSPWTIPLTSFKQDSIIPPPPPLTRLPSTPSSSIDMGNNSFDLISRNYAPSSNQRSISPMSLEPGSSSPCGSMSGSYNRLVETPAKPNSLENGTSGLTHNERNALRSRNSSIYNTSIPVEQFRPDSNSNRIVNRTTRLGLLSSKSNLKDISTEQPESFTEYDVIPDASTSQNVLNSRCLRKNINVHRDVAQDSENIGTRVCDDELYSMDKAGVSLNDLSSARPRNQDGFSMNYVNIPA